MKIKILSKAILGLILGSAILFPSCAGGEDFEYYLPVEDQNQVSARPVRLDMNGVKGFAVLGNDHATKANTKSGDQEVGDTIQEPVNIPAPYSLYSINENNEISLSVFYFEVTNNDEGLQEVLENELEGAIQLVPSLLTDLGKYILFSGCQFFVCKDNLSQEVQQTCYEIVQNLQNKHEHGTVGHEYLLRKSDGALFDITEQYLFTYYATTVHNSGLGFGLAGVEFGMADNLSITPDYTHLLTSIVEDKYFIHNDNIYVVSSYQDGVRKIVDNCDAIDIVRVTQRGNDCCAVVDKDDNVYARLNGELHIYLAGGGFDMDSRYYDSDSFIGMDTDDQGNAYLFTKDYSEKGFVVTSLADGKVKEIYNTGADFWIYDSWNNILRFLNRPTGAFIPDDADRFTHRLGYQNGAFWWLFGLDSDSHLHIYQLPVDSPFLCKYDPAENAAHIVEFPANIKDALEARYDCMSYGKICCGVRVDGINVEVTQIDILNETTTTNTYEVEPLSSITGHIYKTANYSSPVLYVTGRNNINGANAVLSVNLLTGDNSGTFAGDSRDVVTLLRIN